MNRALNISVWLRMLRMKGANSSHELRMFSFPSIIIAAIWVSLWFLWPHGEIKVMRRQPVLFSPRVVFVKASDNLNSRSSSFDALKMSTEAGDTVVVTPWLASRQARILERNTIASDESARGRMMRGGDNPLFMGMEGYSPVWEDIPVFNSTTDGIMHLTVEPMGALWDYGFQVPEFLSDIKKNDIPWSVAVFVEIDRNGKVENVFLESGCGNKEINSIVVKSMYRGKLTIPGTRCEGRVKVNFGAN